MDLTNFFAVTSYSSTAAEKDATNVVMIIVLTVLAMAIICGCMSYTIGKPYKKYSWFFYGFFFSILGVIVAAVRAVELKIDACHGGKARMAAPKPSYAAKIEEKHEKHEDYDDSLI